MNYIKNKESHITKVHNNIKSKSLLKDYLYYLWQNILILLSEYTY